MGPPTDPVALLLPDATKDEVDFAERLTRALCLLSSDAVDSGSTSVCVSLSSARDELDLYHASTVGRLLEDLLIHVSLELLPEATHLTLPVPRRSYASAWSHAFAAMGEEERRQLGLEVPAPGTPAVDVLGGLVDSMEAHASSSRGPSKAVSSRIEPSKTGGARPASGSPDLAGLVAQLWRIRYRRLAGEVDSSSTSNALEDLLVHFSFQRGARARSLRRTVLGDLVALQLDRGQVAAARETLLRAGPTARRPADVRGPLEVLGLAVQWWLGDDPMPRLEAAFDRCSAARRPPAGWSELGRHVQGVEPQRQLFPWNTGGQADHSHWLEWTAEAARSRKHWGASALIVSIVQPGGALSVVASDVAPGLVAHLDAWVTQHRHSLAERGALEHEVGCSARSALLVAASECAGELGRLADQSIGGGMRGPAGARVSNHACSLTPPRAIVAEPLLDPDGEPAGLLWMEFPTRWIPAAVHRAAAARALLAEYGLGPLAGAMGSTGLTGRQRQAARSGTSVATEIDLTLDGVHKGEADPRGERVRAALQDVRSAWGRAVATLQLKTAERRWIAFQVGGDLASAFTSQGATVPVLPLHPVADGGEAAERLGPPCQDGTWAIHRSLRTGGPIRYTLDEGVSGEIEPTMLHRGAASGAAVPLHRGGRVMAVLSLESIRRGDARIEDVERWFETLQESGPMMEATLLSAKDRMVFDGGFAFSEEDPEFRPDHEALCTLGDSSSDLLVVGEVGTGRRTLARMVHHASSRSGNSGLLVVRDALGVEAEELRRIAADDRIGTLILADVEWLVPAAQAALTDLCAAPLRERPRVIATIHSGRVSAAASDHGAARRDGSELYPPLMRQLGRVVVRCQRLRDRRHVIPVRAQYLLRRIADREGGRPLELSDAAVAVLWRQQWEDNHAGLESALYSLHLARGRAPLADGPPSVVEAAAVESTLREAGIEIVPRLPSRDPRPSDVHSALWATRTATRRFNKTRAAFYLGWDPNTLAARLKDMGLATLGQVVERMAPLGGLPARVR